MARGLAAGAASSDPPSLLDLAHPFTRLLAAFALGYAALMLLLLRLYIALPDRVKRGGRPRTAAAPPPRQSAQPDPPVSTATTTASPARQRLRGRRRSDSAGDALAATTTPAGNGTGAGAGAGAVRTAPASTLVVLGSGGHTKEMLTMLRGLDPARYHPAVFVRAASDTRSDGMVKTAGGSLQPDATLTIPRSRSVGQSWLTTPFTTLHALAASVWLVWRMRPDLILCNGPGTCLPLCLAGFALRLAGVKRVRIVFIESLCRVQSLSLTGRLLYYWADRFVVQWPGLVDRYPLAEYIGQVC